MHTSQLLVCQEGAALHPFSYGRGLVQQRSVLMSYCPHELAKQIDYDECVTLMDVYDPIDRVVLIHLHPVTLSSSGGL
jgi:hypothetical protein